MPVNSIGSDKLSPHPVCLWKSSDEPERLMQRHLIGSRLPLAKLLHALPVDDLQII